MKYILILLILASCSSLKNATTWVGEKTGNKKLIKASADMTPREEYYLGRTVSAKILSANKLVKNQKLQHYVNTLGTFLSLHSKRPETFRGYRFAVVEGAAPFALSTPDGTVFISEGLLNIIYHEDELAAVLAHEIAHVALRHVEASIKTANQVSLLGDALDLYLKSQKQEKKFSQFKSVTDIVLNRGFEQPQEMEADKDAVDILGRAGFDPSMLSAVLYRLKDEPGFSSKHPPSSDRITALEGTLVRTNGKFQRLKRFTSTTGRKN